MTATFQTARSPALSVFDTKDGKLLRRGPTGPLPPSSDGRLRFVPVGEKPHWELHVVDARSDKLVRKFPAKLPAAFSPDSRYLAAIETTTDRGTVDHLVLFDLRNGQKRIVAKPVFENYNLAFSPDGQLL